LKDKLEEKWDEQVFRNQRETSPMKKSSQHFVAEVPFGFVLRILGEPGGMIRARLRRRKMLKLKVRNGMRDAEIKIDLGANPLCKEIPCGEPQPVLASLVAPVWPSPTVLTRCVGIAFS
jgi:hypothetical protein